ncbi:TetR family transcriptional regulator [Pedobacter petrophilus]|uniref:TetR family transcriptional regulator n=1 Tax=Pedobacter petrophilus TaxID=1908241 RepID=A0A7K0FWX0_9SPHI|nr:TetR/AcrR family transcriptional regulator [Pedobacter petrophilus]MRX76068.1 TetR family transcriptional regulator [Pedobacter petrophilus]
MSKAEKTRGFIIEKTAPIFNRKGYAGTSLNDITDATGLTKGSIYGNFANKDEVALAAFDYNVQSVEMKIISEMNNQHTAKGKLLAYVIAYQGLIAGKISPGGCPVLNTSIDADDTHPALREKALNALLSWKNRMTGLVQDGIANNEIASRYHPEQIALTIIAMIEGGIMISRLTNSHETRELLLESSTAYINNLST